jgi:glycosyltransferase involved in cell wall biosynthesis
MPARNATITIEHQLEALARQDTPEPWELVLVDNGSTDQTAAVARRWVDRLRHMRIVSCDLVGINRARNAGIRAAKAERILLCDADDVVSTGWIREMGEALRSVDLVGGAMDYDSLNDSFVQLTMQHVESTELPISGNLRYAVGANLGFRRSVFDSLDGFDESFLYGSDDIDFCWRAQYEGFVLGFVPSAVVHRRLRYRLGALARQCFAYANGNALLCAKHRALGRLHLSRADQAKSATSLLKSLVRVYWLAERQHRWLYVRRAATAVGSIWGLVHFDLLSRDAHSGNR